MSYYLRDATYLLRDYYNLKMFRKCREISKSVQNYTFQNVRLNEKLITSVDPMQSSRLNRHFIKIVEWVNYFITVF